MISRERVETMVTAIFNGQSAYTLLKAKDVTDIIMGLLEGQEPESFYV